MTEYEDLGNKRKQETPLSILLAEAEDRFLLVSGFTKRTKFMIFLNNGHILRPEFRNKVDVTWLLFMLENESSRLLTGNDISVPLEINFTRLTEEDVLGIQKRIGIAKNYPYDRKNPFSFPYEFIGFYLPLDKDIGKVLSSWCDLMVSEWRVIHAKRLFIGFGYDEFAKEIDQGKTPDIYSKFDSPEIEIVQTQGIELKALRGLWLANDIIIRLKAIWDKLLGELLLKAYFNASIPDKFKSKCNKLQKIIESHPNLTDQQIKYLQLILELASAVENIKEWRDHDVHMISETILGVFTRDETAETLFTIWEKINNLHNLTREAIFISIGFFTSIDKEAVNPFDRDETNPFIYIAGFTKDQLKKFDPSNDIELRDLEELRSLAKKRLLQENEQRVREILLNIWRLEIGSSANFNYDE